MKGDPVSSGLEKKSVERLADSAGRIAEFRLGLALVGLAWGRLIDDGFPVGGHEELLCSEKLSKALGDGQGIPVPG